MIQNLKNALKEKTVVIVTQKRNLLEIANRVIVMNEGRVVIDAPKEKALQQLRGEGSNNEK